MLEDTISPSLQKTLIDYSLGNMTKPIDPDHQELIELYLNDKNSSTIRQFITSKVCGYNNSFKKLGFDATDANGNHKEIKPTNKPKTCKSKYAGKFGISDYTVDRYGKDIHANVHILQSFFLDGRLMYVMEFPLIDCDKRMRFLIDKFVVNRGQKQIRSAEFSFRDLNPDNIIIKYVSKNIEDCKHIVSEKLYKFVTESKVIGN
jgi:hypothetical protein